MLFKGKASPGEVRASSHHIKITQLPGTEVVKDGKHCIKVKIELDNNLWKQNGTIWDPCTVDEHKACTRYLDELLRNENYYAEEAITNAQLASAKIDSYGEELFRELDFKTLSLKYSTVEIDIHECEERPGALHSIFSFRWEQLEVPVLWKQVIKQIAQPKVTVRRVILPLHGATSLQLPKSRPSLAQRAKHSQDASHSRKNILLVIARDLQCHSDEQRRDMSPALAQCAITLVKARLKGLGQLEVDLEIVRPGSLNALKEHLARKPDGHFDLVHFDTHGILKQTRESNG